MPVVLESVEKMSHLHGLGQVEGVVFWVRYWLVGEMDAGNGMAEVVSHGRVDVDLSSAKTQHLVLMRVQT